MTEQRPGVGEIWLVRHDQGPDVSVLIIGVHDRHVQVLLCGDEVCSATETDAVLGPSVTGLPGRLLIHGDVSAPILKGRLSEAVGEIALEVVARIVLRGRGLDFNSSDLGRGRAILSEDDPRWDWKLEKHKELPPAAGQCPGARLADVRARSHRRQIEDGRRRLSAALWSPWRSDGPARSSIPRGAIGGGT